MARSCGTCRPPADGTRDRELIDRFGEFLAEVGPAPRPDEVLRLSPAARYRFRFLVWRCSPAALDLAEALAR